MYSYKMRAKGKHVDKSGTYAAISFKCTSNFNTHYPSKYTEIKTNLDQDQI